jgi:hypothetical protein
LLQIAKHSETVAAIVQHVFKNGTKTAQIIQPMQSIVKAMAKSVQLLPKNRSKTAKIGHKLQK